MSQSATTPALSHGLLAGLGLAGLVALALWFFNHYERVTEREEIGYQGEARYNPLLAAQYLLARMGIKHHSLHQLPRLDQGLHPQGTLVLLETLPLLSARQSQELLAWVEQGGHLIVSSHVLDDEDSEEHPLLETFHLTQQAHDLNDEAVIETAPLTFSWEADPAPLTVAFHPNYSVSASAPPLLQLAGAHGSHLLRRAQGQGWVTLLSDLWFIHNDQIGRHDHARFFWDLLHTPRVPSEIWLVYPLEKIASGSATVPHKLPTSSGCEECAAQDTMPSLGSLLWQHARPVLISAAVWLLVWLWLRSRRFGPLLPDRPPIRRRLLEHIEASGEFFWHQGQASLLLRSVRQSLHQQLALRYADWASLAPLAQSERLARDCALTPAAIYDALYNNNISSPALFTQHMQHVKQMFQSAPDLLCQAKIRRQ